MKRCLILTAIVLPGVVLSGVACAQEPAPRLRYDYVSAVLAVPALDELGFEVGGSTAVTEKFVVFGNYASFEPRDGFDRRSLEIGVARVWRFRRNMDFVGSLAYADNELDTPSRQDAVEEGFIAGVGLRAWATPRLELSGAASLDKSRGAGSKTVLELGAEFLAGPRLSYGGRVEDDEDDTTTFLGVRFYFGASRRPPGR